MSTHLPEKIETDFTKQMGIRYPIVSAPMFLVSNVDMVVATSNAGGLGTFPALNFRPLEKYREALKQIRSRTKHPFGVNIIVQQKNQAGADHLKIGLEEGVPLFITSLGNPKSVIADAHRNGAKVYCDVVGLEHAQKAADLGADGLVAVGAGAGGHAGTISPFALVPYLKDKVGLPVLAAGSIVDGRGLLAALALGASGAYLGTRFIASTESPASEDYKQAILAAGCSSIVNTERVDGFPGNFIRTPKLEKLGIEPGFFEKLLTHHASVNRSLALLRAGRALFAPPEKASYQTIFSAGHGVGLIHSVESIEKIIHDLVASYVAAKKALP